MAASIGSACTEGGRGVADAGLDASVDASSVDGAECTTPAAEGLSLSVVPIANTNVGFRFELAPDGSFSGHVLRRLARCDGVLTTPERTRLVEAVRTAALMCRADMYCPSEIDVYVYDMAVREPTSGMSTHFCFMQCRESPDTSMAGFLDAAFAPVGRVSGAAGCTGADYPVLSRTETCSVPSP